MELQTLFFLGPSGSGKGTQLQKVEEYLKENDSEKGIIELDLGSLFRKFWEGKGYVENLSRDLMLKGALQPSFLQINLWTNYIIENLKGGEHLIIDGTPRRLTDLEAWEAAIKFFGRPNPKLIFINISKEESVGRLLRRAELSENPRPEDKDVALIENRYEWFEKSVMPVVDAMKKNDMFTVLEINGEQDVNMVANDIFSGLEWQ